MSVKKITGFALNYFPVIAYILMTDREFTMKELLNVFNHGIVAGFINSGVSKGAIEKIEKGKYRLNFEPLEIKISKISTDGDVIMVRNGLTLDLRLKLD